MRKLFAIISIMSLVFMACGGELDKAEEGPIIDESELAQMTDEEIREVFDHGSGAQSCDFMGMYGYTGSCSPSYTYCPNYCGHYGQSVIYYNIWWSKYSYFAICLCSY